jgi:energy-coupling factor transporter ATP-binding protein EcfA2
MGSWGISMRIEIKNCNNIEVGLIDIVEDCLNIKYAINGTGKTTIAKAMESCIKDKNSGMNELIKLKPFKFRNNEENNPEINGLDTIDKILIFNEDYVNQYVFLQDELVKNSFDIFIRNEKYETGMQQINELIKKIAETFEDNKDIDLLIQDLSELSDCFGKSKTGFSNAGSIAKGLGKGNKIEHIPEGLEEYSAYIRHGDNVKWLKWQINGNDYLDIVDKCPYCTSGISDKKERIISVSKEYDSKLIEHLNKVINVIQRLSSYFTSDTNENILQITKNVNGLKKEEIKYLVDIKAQIDDLREKLFQIKKLSFHTLKDVDKVIKIISNYKIDLRFFTFLNTETTGEKVDDINSCLDSILEKAGILQGEVNKQKKHIEETIKIYKAEINSFLKYAGYNYHVDIIEELNETYKLKLRHNDFSENIDNVKLHLSYGERNAFALVLFMFEVIKNSPNLVILDDPISSFDKNKKFAIINMLFRGQKSLRNKTVLMLTHDFDPIVDIIYNLPHKFNPSPKAAFLENIKGVLNEKEVLKSDIKTFLDIAEENIRILNADINKLIYLRRVLEITNNKTEGYQLLSNLFHKREVPLYKENGYERNMTDEEITSGTDHISRYVHNFDYRACLSLMTDANFLVELYKNAENNYEKLQVYRIIKNENNENDVIKKFINETFHIENDYLFQLNPCKYQTVPQYIIDECNKDIRILESEDRAQGEGNLTIA